MTRRSLSLCNRVLAPIQSASILFMLLILSGVANYLSAAALQQAPSGPKIWLQDNQRLSVAHTGAAASVMTGTSQPVAMTSGDIDGDGVADLLVGYRAPGGGVIAVHRGNLDAFAPQSDASFQAIGRGEFPAPFLLNANTFTVPFSPDFIALGNFKGNGNQDLVVAAKGGNTLSVFPGDGKGGFGDPQTVAIQGGVTALAAGDFGNSGQFTTLLVGAKGIGKSFSLVALAGSFQGLAVTGTFPLSAVPSSIDFANFGGSGRDAAFLAGGQIFILRSSSMQVVPVSLPVSARAFALGSFIFDRSGGTQIAVLASDGSVQIAARSEFDPRTYTVEEFGAIRQAKVLHEAPPLGPLATFPNAWKIVDTFPGVGTLAPGQTPVFFRTRVSSNGADDIMWLNAGNSQMAVISHPDVQPGAQTFAPGQVSIKPYTGSPISALPMRINIDGRPGVLAIHQGEAAPSMLMPIPDPTFFPNRLDDIAPRGTGVTCLNTVAVDGSGDCTLREAVIKANATPGTDNIQLQAGTYSLTRGRIASPAYDAVTGTLNINDSVNITGTVDGGGNPTSIITWGTLTSGLSVDMIMAVNEDISILSNATASISNVVIQNGVNHGQHGNDGDGGCMESDTGTSGNANLTLTNVIIQNCATLQGGGGGLVSFNFLAHNNNGFVTISNSTIQNNSAVDNPSSGAGGGIALSNDTRMVMTNSKVLNNLATQVIGGQKGQGGGIMAFFPNGNFTGNPETIIHSSTISGNKAAGFGGGMQTQARLLIDQGTVISNNVAGTDGVNPVAAQDGGGLYINNFPPTSCPPGLTCDATLTHVTITGNTATGNGGGISNGNAGTFPNAAGPLTMTFSRLAGNSATGLGSNLKNGGTTVSAINNWWGTNAAATTINTTGGGGTTFSPFLVLTHNATATPLVIPSSNAVIRINGTASLTGDMSNDSLGAPVALASLTQIIGLPITFDNPVLGSIPQAQPETLNASAQATATFNAGGVSGRGSAHATVDQGVVSANSNLIASATEAATTATITTVGKHNFAAGETVVISGVGVAGYNGTFLISATPAPTTFTYTAGAGLAASSGGLANVGIIILEPLQMVKSFNPTTVAVGVSSTLTFSVNNPNVIPVDASFTDTLPAGLVVAATPGVTNTCGGTVTAIAGSGSISYSNASLPVGACSVTVKVSSATDNTYNNTVTINSTAAGTGAQSTSSASLTVINPPTITKAFGAASIPLNGTTSLTFTLTSTNVNLTLNGVAFTDNLPAGLVVASSPNLSNTCGGTATAIGGSSSVSLSGATLIPGASCTVSVDVQGTTAGVKNNSVQASSTNAGTGNTSNASITVVAPPTISKAFGAASIPLNGSTSLSFTITNPNTTVALTGVGFSDTLPAGLVISTPNGLTGICGGGTITATAGTNVISLSGGTIAASASCTFSVNVTGIAAGLQANTTGNVTSTEGGTGGTASASIDVVAPPSIAKVFNPSTIALNATTSLTFTITNPAANTVAETGVAFTDTLPTGLVVSTPNGLSNTCGGTATAVAGSTSITLTGGSIAVNTNCTLIVNVTGTASGQYTNTSGAVTSTNGGTGNTASANLTVATPPSITKAFGAASIPLNGTTSLTFTINNPNTTLALTGIAFTDNLPAGLVVATPNALNNTCGGTATAVGGSGSVSLSAGTLAASASCTVSVNVPGTTAGLKNNSVQVTSTEGGTGNTSNASITVVAPPVIIKAFGAASIPLNGSTSLSFTIQNNNTTTTLTGVGFSDTLPAGLVISTPNGLTGACGGGTITATAGTNVISLSGASLAASTSCTFSVNVTGITAGLQANTTGNVTSTEGGTGGTATASIKVEAPPSIAKVFTPSSIALNATTSLTFTITNPAANVDALTGVAFTDTLPTGLTVANASATVCGGTLTTTAPTGIALTGATIALNSQCQFSVTVTGAASGQFTNTTGNVTSTNGGTGNTATANLTVATPPSITKAFGVAQVPLNGTTSLTFTIQNPNTNVTLNGIAFTDNLPAGLIVASTPNLSNTCGGTATAVGGSGSVSLSAGTLATSASCTVSVNVQGVTAGVKNNSVQVTSTEGGTGNTSNASITVVGPPVIIKAFGAASIPLNGSTSLSFTIQNNNTTTTLTGVGFNDTLPAGLVISTPNGLTGSCGGGTITATQATSVISLSGASLAASNSCTFAVNVTGIAAGLQNNTTGNVTSTEGGTGGTASASIKVEAPPSIAKVFNPSSIGLNATTSLTFTITNPAANVDPLTGVAFTDTLPTGLTVANASATVCGGTLTTTSPTGIALSGATIAVNSQCQFSVTVTGAAAGSFTNTTGNVSSTNGGTGNTASASLSVATPPTITKAFGAASIPLNGTTSLTFTIDNPNTGTQLNGVAFTDSLPAGLVVATPNGLTGTPSCVAATTAVAGSSTISLTGVAMGPSSNCTISVNITGTTAGVKNNSVSVTATESGAGNTSNASITVEGPPVVIKAFGAASIPLNGVTSLTFTVQNNNTTSSLTGIGFGDTLPAGLSVATPNGLTGSCGGGTITTGTVSGFSVVNLSGATLAASTSCTFSVNVVGIAPGTQNNTTGQVTSTQGGTGGTASASIVVVAPPTIAKAFSPTVIAVNGVSTLTFTITNPAANTVAETGVAFSDTLPAGIVVATPNGLTNTCAGTGTATASSGSVSLTGGTIATVSSCTLSVNVTGSAVGTYNNTSGAVSSTNGGTGNTASATLTIAAADLTITKTHSGTFTRGQNGANWIITVKNSGVGPTTGTVTVVDTLPNVQHPPVPTAISGTGWTCTLATLTCTRSDVLAPGASYPPITLTVNIPINIQNNFTNTATVSGGGETNTGNNTATDTISLGPPIVITAHATTASVVAGGTATFMFDVQDQDPTLGLITFGCGGLPVGTACSFSPATTNQPLTTMTMTITTSNGKALAATARNAGSGSRAPMYAALFFPVFGMVGIAFSGRRGRKARMRLALVVIGALALLSFAGCAGGLHGIVTPAGNYQISVSAASATVQVSTPVTLSVQ